MLAFEADDRISASQILEDLNICESCFKLQIKLEKLEKNNETQKIENTNLKNENDRLKRELINLQNETKILQQQNFEQLKIKDNEDKVSKKSNFIITEELKE